MATRVNNNVDWVTDDDGRVVAQRVKPGQEVPIVTVNEQTEGVDALDFGGQIMSLSTISGGVGPLVIFEGDSRTAQSYNPPQGYTCYGYVGWVRALSKFKARAQILAVSGNRTSDMQARKKQVSDAAPWAVVRWCGVNDLSNGVTGAEALAAIIDCARSDVRSGAWSVLLLETGFNGWNAAAVEQMRVINQGLIDFARTNSRVRIVNTLDTAMDLGAAVQVPVTYLAGAFGDGSVHPSVAMSYKIGAKVAALLDSLAGVSADDAPYLMPGDTSNLLANPHFGAGGGAFSAGWSGSVPQGWYGWRDANATIVSAVKASAEVPNMREVELTITTTGAAAVSLWQDPIAGVAAGDNLVASAELAIEAPTALQHAQFNLYSVVGGVTAYAFPLFYSSGYDTATPGSSWPQVNMVQRSPETKPLVVPSGAITSMRASMSLQFRGAGGAVVRLRKPMVKKVAAGYQS